ncbi:MAG: PrgI family protein, partial [Syntrophorhabdus sp.]
MAYVNVPKDLNRVKTKVALNLTRRQLICFSAAGLVGVPLY